MHEHERPSQSTKWHRIVQVITMLPNKASIFTAELAALNLALDIIRSMRKKFIIFSDSLSSLMPIHNRHRETGYVQKFISDYSQLVNSGKTIALCWIPSHVGIRGNERADVAAKSALSSTISAVKCPPTDLYQSLTDHCQRLWQVEFTFSPHVLTLKFRKESVKSLKSEKLSGTMSCST